MSFETREVWATISLDFARRNPDVVVNWPQAIRFSLKNSQSHPLKLEVDSLGSFFPNSKEVGIVLRALASQSARWSELKVGYDVYGTTMVRMFASIKSQLPILQTLSLRRTDNYSDLFQVAPLLQIHEFFHDEVLVPWA
ncbi:hypothetical protein C8J56DRAFT_1019776 [Mycena floridula]|nr:hypothetical protein C8J56DRAFT_1019776 [Mycena floridula]